MLAGDMRPGWKYRLKDGEIVECSYEGATGYMIVHPPGEPDTQSSFGIKKTEIVESVS